MARRTMHLFLALALAIGALGGLTVAGSAQNGLESGPYNVYFPWVPNGSVIDDPRDGIGETGPYFGTITIQNLESDDIEISYATTATGAIDTATIDAHGSLTLTVDALFDDEDEVTGSGVVVWAEFDDEDGDPARIAGVQKQSAPQSPDDDARTGDEHSTVSGYTGTTEDGIGGQVHLPIVQTNSNWNTLIRVTNFDDAASTDVSVTFHPSDAPGWSHTATADDLEPGETATIDLLSLGPPGEWVGSATITADQPVGAVAERVKNETNMLIMNVAQVAPDNGDTQFAPLVFNNWNFWNTGISVANLTDAQNEVTITYYDRDGNLAGDADTRTLPPNGMDFVYTPATNDDEVEFVGSAVIEADGPIVGAVDEVKYFGDDLDTGHAMSYIVEPQTVSSGEALALPLAQKGNPADNTGDATGIQIFNPTSAFAVVAVSWVNQDGIEELTELVLLQGSEGHTSYSMETPALPNDFQGSAVVQVVSGEGAIAAVSNNVNYEVQYDGSASFNLVPTGAIDLEIPDEEVDDLLEDSTS